MLMNADKPGAFERAMARLPEGLFLRSLFTGLLAATITIFALDFRDVLQSDRGQTPGMTRLEPVTMERPSSRDHLRPYLPWTSPVTREGGSLNLPGFDRPPDHGMLREKMSFKLGPDGTASAVGLIESGTAGEFERFLAASKDKVRWLALHSPGGSVPDALAMSRLIRKHEITTAVPSNGYCASSCPLVFAGGSKREAGKGAWIGVHQIYTIDSAIGTIHDGMAEGQKISAVCQQHLNEMGVDPQVWVHAMRTPKHQIYVFTPKELKTFKLATHVHGDDAKGKRKS